MLCDFTNLLVEQSLCDRGLDGNLAFLQVSLALAHDGISHLGLVSHVGHLYLRHDLHAVGAELLGVDDLKSAVKEQNRNF